VEGTWVVELVSIEGRAGGVEEEIDEIKREGEGGKKEFDVKLELKVVDLATGVDATIVGKGVFLGTDCLLIGGAQLNSGIEELPLSRGEREGVSTIKSWTKPDRRRLFPTRGNRPRQLDKPSGLGDC